MKIIQQITILTALTLIAAINATDGPPVARELLDQEAIDCTEVMRKLSPEKVESEKIGDEYMMTVTFNVDIGVCFENETRRNLDNKQPPDRILGTKIPRKTPGGRKLQGFPGEKEWEEIEENEN